MGYSYNKSHTVTFFKKIEQSDDIEEMLMYEEDYPDKYQKYVKNTWKDWKLIPLTPPIFSQPPLKESYLDIPGMNGLIDLSFSFGPDQLYSNRTGSFEFYAINETGNESYWSKICREVSSFLQRNEIYVILDDDKGYYYRGKFYLNDVKSDKISSKIVINYNVYPYKFSIISTKYHDLLSKSQKQSWLWDPFDFENSIIQDIGCYTLKDFSKLFSIELYTSDNQDETEPHITIYLGENPRYINIHAKTIPTAAYLSRWHLYFKFKSRTGELIWQDDMAMSTKNDMEKDIVYHFPNFEEISNPVPYEDVEKLEIYVDCSYFTEGTEPYINLVIDYRGSYI